MLRVSFPSSRYLSNAYFHNIIAGDKDSALKLGRNKCEILVEDVDKHIQLYKGKQVRNIQINVENSKGSDDELQIITIDFEYSDSKEGPWQAGKMKLLTEFESIYPRYVCESLDFHGA